MTAPMTPNQIRAQMKRWGIRYREPFKDWTTHNRGTRGNGWINVNGFMVHHTGSDTQSIASYLYSGSLTLPGPLCHFGLDTNGVVEMIGWGRANHAGSGDARILERVIGENYTGVLKPNTTDADGNGRFYGVECYYSGSHGMSPSQYVGVCKLAAAVCEFHGWTAKSVIGHGEWQPGKWDPGYAPGRLMDMNAQRNDVQRLLDKGPAGDSMSDSETPDKPPQVFIDVLRTDAIRKPRNMGTEENPYWWGESFLRHAVEEAHDANMNTQKILEILKRNGME